MARNNCNELCYAIHSERDGHIKRRKNQDEKILGSKDQFCAAFYHVPEWNHSRWTRIAFRQHFCLDEDKCVIGKEAKKSIKQFGQNADNIAREANKFSKEANEFSKDAKEFTKDVLQFAKDAKHFVTEGNKIARKANEFYHVSDIFQANVEKIVQQKKKKGISQQITKICGICHKGKNIC